MPTAYTLTGDIGDLLGNTTVVPTAEAWLETNVRAEDALVHAAVGGTVRLGGLEVPLNADGTFTIAGLVGSDSTDLNVAAGVLQYRLVVKYRNPATGREQTWRDDWFHLNGDSDIATVVKAISPEVAETGADIIAQAEAARDQASEIAGLTGEDSAVAFLVGNPSFTQTALDGRYATDADVAATADARIAATREVPSGVAGLDATGKLYQARIPDMSDIYAASNQLAHLRVTTAAADGTEDDQPTIQTILNNAGAGAAFGLVKVSLPPGTYGLGAGLVIPAGVHLVMESGATLKALLGVSNLVTVNGGAVLEGGTVDGNGLAFTRLVAPSGTGARVRGVRVTNSGGSGYGINNLGANVSDMRIEDCELDNLVNCVRIDQNTTNAWVVGNHFHDWEARAIWAITTTGAASKGVRILDNRILPHKNVGTGQPRQPIAIQGVDTDLHTDMRVNNNTVIGAGTSHADPTTPGSADLISLHRCDGFEVIGNHVSLGGDVGITVAQQCKNGVVSNNVARENDSVGICIGSSTSTEVRNLTISGNTTVNNAQERMSDGVARARSGILVNRARHCTVVGNVSGDTQTTPTQDYCFSYLDCLNVAFVANISGDTQVGGYYSEGSNTAVKISEPAAYVALTADKVVNNSTTLTNTLLAAGALQKGGVYQIECDLIYNASTGADASIKWDAPAGAAINWSEDALAAASTASTSTIVRTARTVGSVATLGGAGVNVHAFPTGVIVMGGTSGSLTLQFAQGTAEASDAILRAGSWLKVTRIG